MVPSVTALLAIAALAQPASARSSQCSQLNGGTPGPESQANTMANVERAAGRSVTTSAMTIKGGAGISGT